MKREDFCFRSFIFSFLSHRKHRTVKGGRGNTKEKFPCDAQLKILHLPIPSSEAIGNLIQFSKQIQTVTLEDMDAEVEKCDTAGYVLSVRVGKEKVSGEEFRTNYHLASSCFTLQKYNGKLRITTRGVGHGLGMSQNTANELAKAGRNYEEILEEFFTDTEIKEVTDIVSADRR